MGSNFPILLAISFLISAIAPSLSDPRISQAALVCGNRTADSRHRQAFVENFLSVLNSVTPQIASRRFAWASEGKTRNDSVFAFGECLKDLSRRDCDLCFATCKTLILRCLPFQMATRGGRNYLDGCYLRYEDYDFSGEAVSPEDRTACGNVTSGGDHGAFAENALWLVGNLSSAAPENDGFFVGAVEKGDSRVYGLAQCWENVNRSSCRLCLKAAAKAVSSCVPMTEGRAMNSGCYMRYSSAKFYNNSGEDAAADSENNGGGLAIVLAVVFSVVAAVMIVSSAAFFLRRRMIKRRLVRKQLGALAAAVNKSNLNFKYELLEKATNYFDNSNKLGQGGSGSVFKGVLADGKTVAVKRLVFNTRQWVDEFFNEVNLISGVHHKNLVGLLGCSITGPESLLVYEYVPNKSLHHHLSDSCCAQNLSWAARYRIILGAAEGLAFLHEESPSKIIHRDIKLSNILLDEHYNAKIADFGLARLIPDDKSHLSTGIAGTLGYMAPEYLVRGKLTEKADVYSFGVVVIEIVCGKRKTPRAAPDPLSVLQTVWKLHTAGRLAEAVDPSLEGAFDAEEAVRVLQIGLLCAQASAELRPAMSAVVRMLRQGDPIPAPAQPPFLRSNPDGVSFGASSSSAPSSSVNSITVSEVDPR